MMTRGTGHFDANLKTTGAAGTRFNSGDDVLIMFFRERVKPGNTLSGHWLIAGCEPCLKRKF